MIIVYFAQLNRNLARLSRVEVNRQFFAGVFLNFGNWRDLRSFTGWVFQLTGQFPILANQISYHFGIAIGGTRYRYFPLPGKKISWCYGLGEAFGTKAKEKNGQE